MNTVIAHAPARGHVERLDGPRLVGWAVGHDGTAGQLTLSLGDVPVRLTVTRHPRADVSAALGLAGDLPSGFTAALPPAVWPLLTGATLDLRIDGEPLSWGVPPPGPDAVAGWPAPLSVVPADVSMGAPAAADPPPVRGNVDTLESLCIVGWAWRDATPDAPASACNLSVTCNGTLLDCGVVRTDRRDVADALGLDPQAMVGFEIELPGHAWRHVDGAGPRIDAPLSLRVLADGVEITTTPVLLRAADVVDAVERARRAEVDAAPESAPQRQFGALLALEHAVLAGLLPTLPGATARWLDGLAARFGLTAWVTAQTARPDTAAGLAGPRDPIPSMEAGLWELQRQFNLALQQPDVDLSAVLTALRSDPSMDESSWSQFVLTTVDHFCALGRFDLVRHQVPAGQVAALADAADQWTASLALPFLAHEPEPSRLVSLLWRLAGRLPGWLNSACVLQCTRTATAASQRQRWSAAQIEEVVWGLLGLLDSLGGDYWSRLWDRALMAVLVELLRARPGLADAPVLAIEQAVRRHYALSPDFWTLADPVLDGNQPGDAGLRALRAALGRLQTALASGPALPAQRLPALWADLDLLRIGASGDAAQCERELAMAALPALADAARAPVSPSSPGLATVALRRLEAVDALEPLRLAAYPSALVAPLADRVDDIAGRVRSASGTPRGAVFGVQRALGAAWRTWQDAGVTAIDQAQTVVRLAHGVTRPDAAYLGLDLRARLWCASAPTLDDGPAAATAAVRALRALQTDLSRAIQAGAGQWPPPAPLTAALWHLALAQRASGSGTLGTALAELQAQFAHSFGDAARADLALPPASSAGLPEAGPLNDMLVVLYSCRANLTTRVQAIRDTWLRDLTARGVAWCVAVGDGPPGGRLEGDVLALDAPDDYESLPLKTLALLRWVHDHTAHAYVMKIDDDCHVDVDRLLDSLVTRKHHYLGRPLHRAEGGTHRYWHQAKSRSRRGTLSIDKSPEPSSYADGGSGYLLSRFALARLERARRTSAGARLTRSAFMEDKLVGDLLAQEGITVSGEDYEVLVRRRLGPGAMPVATYGNVFLPSRRTPTVVSHLDTTDPLPMLQSHKLGTDLAPARLWPSNHPPTLGHLNPTNQLELLSPPARVDALRDAQVIVVAVARNEIVMAPHFLAHYRRLGVRHFVFIDNLSDDGTREFLHAQPDVVLYSADTDYRQSHYGVAWQQAALAGHGVGRWVLLADLDEFLVYEGCETLALPDHLAALQAEGADAATVLMIDMYPEGDLDAADMTRGEPFAVAPCFDRQALLRWLPGSGCYSNAPTYLSGLRHRLMPDSAPNHFTSQKVAALRYQPWMRLSEGLHYAANVRPSTRPMWFAHFKYHAGFRRKVLDEIARKQHFNGAEEYRKYVSLLTEAAPRMYDSRFSVRYQDSRSFAQIPA